MRFDDPTIDRMERALQAWGAWRAGCGGGEGYPSTSVLHHSWMPPSGGMVSRAPVVGRACHEERELDRCVHGLALKLRDALFVVYVKRMAPAARSAALRCQPATVDARVREAKRQIALVMGIAALC